MIYYEDIYSYIIKTLDLPNDIKAEDRDPMKLLISIFGPNMAKTELKKLQKGYDDLQLDSWEEFQIWCDMKTGLMHTPEEMGKDLGISPATVRKRLTELGIPKYNGNEDNLFGKRFIPDSIYGKLKEILEDWKNVKIEK